MIHTQNFKVAKMIAPVSANGGAYTATSVDCYGFHYAFVLVTLGVIGANGGTCKLTESHDDSTYVDVASATFTLLTASHAGTQHGGWLDLRARRRYLKPDFTAGAGATLLGCYCILSRADEVPDSTTERGLTTVFGPL